MINITCLENFLPYQIRELRVAPLWSCRLGYEQITTLGKKDLQEAEDIQEN